MFPFHSVTPFLGKSQEFSLVWAREPPTAGVGSMGDEKMGGKCMRRRSTCGNLSPVFCLVFLQLEFTAQLSTGEQMGMFRVRLYSDDSA